MNYRKSKYLIAGEVPSTSRHWIINRAILSALHNAREMLYNNHKKSLNSHALLRKPVMCPLTGCADLIYQNTQIGRWPHIWPGFGCHQWPNFGPCKVQKFSRDSTISPGEIRAFSRCLRACCFSSNQGSETYPYWILIGLAAQANKIQLFYCLMETRLFSHLKKTVWIKTFENLNKSYFFR